MSFNAGALFAGASSNGSVRSNRSICQRTNRTNGVSLIEATESAALSALRRVITASLSGLTTTGSIGGESDSEESSRYDRLSSETPKNGLGGLSGRTPANESEWSASNGSALSGEDEVTSCSCRRLACIDRKPKWWLSNRTKIGENKRSDHWRSIGSCEKINSISIESARSILKITSLSDGPRETFSGEPSPESTESECRESAGPPELLNGVERSAAGRTAPLAGHSERQPPASRMQSENPKNEQRKSSSLSTNHFDLILIIRLLVLLLAATQHVHCQQGGVFPANQFK